MKGVYHILNGDALCDNFPTTLEGSRIVIRECLIDGDCHAETLDAFIEIRKEYFKDQLNVHSEEYEEQVVSQFNLVLNIPDESEVNLWFEDDLFCQSNFWFTVNLLASTHKNLSLKLVRPEKLTHYGFGAYNQKGLKALYKNRISIHDVSSLSELWNAYATQDNDAQKALGQKLKTQYPFIAEAIAANLERMPSSESLGRPLESLKSISKELNSVKMKDVFPVFNERECIYGFGSLQVEQMLKSLNL